MAEYCHSNCHRPGYSDCWQAWSHSQNKMAARNVMFVSSLILPRLTRDSHKYNRNFVSAVRNGCSSFGSSNSAKEIVEWMRNYAPVFRVQSDAISVLREPAQFFQTFTVCIVICYIRVCFKYIKIRFIFLVVQHLFG
jgi:hypothetical protein